eukprot:CAMPEP_0176081882 /NCGR_PEP_ID=MMETSP0120_2-20121206/40958_1 /TAXON_ID=160619 /ORGANISM="Kryptoperidinium foliaceum, Strain CCMP 1326" /LENGTH=101 /DNA_ID=CAMNT_0017415649 /DNA_START=218 /DNA_END=520 /DNA_ORIENTATION=-
MTSGVAEQQDRSPETQRGHEQQKEPERNTKANGGVSAANRPDGSEEEKSRLARRVRSRQRRVPGEGKRQQRWSDMKTNGPRFGTPRDFSGHRVSTQAFEHE